MAINLLPPKQKRLARSVYRTHRFIAVLIVVDLLLLSLIVLLFAFSGTLKHEKASNAATLAALGNKSGVIEFNQLREEINLMDKYASVVKASLASSTQVVRYLGETVELRSEGIQLTNISFAVEPKDQKIILSGTADTRQNLLDFKGRLEALPWVATVDSPVANLISDADSTFSLIIVLVKNKK